MSEEVIQCIGGPLDGIVIAAQFEEGEIFAADTLEYHKHDAEWSAESVYRVKGGALIYDPEATKKLAAITKADPTQPLTRQSDE